MNTDAAIWFIAGLLVGFISMRAVGWLCVVGLCFLCVGQARAASVYVDVTWTGGTASGPYLFGVQTCGTGPTALYALGDLTTSSGHYLSGPWSTTWNNMLVGINVCGSYVYTACEPTASKTIYVTINVGACTIATNGAPAPQYIFNGACITNNSAGVMGFYAHLSSTYTGTSDYYSGPLVPGGYWCLPGLTNATPFTLEWQKVYYNSDGGTNAIDIFPPINAGTNAPPTVQGGSSAGGPANGANPIQGGVAGQFSNTNLTGGQFQFGMSNMVSVIYDMGNGQMGLLRMVLNQSQSNNPANANLQTNINYKGDFQNLTNQGLKGIDLLTSLSNRLNNLNDFTFFNTASNWQWFSNVAWVEAAGFSNQFYTSGIAGVTGLADFTNTAALHADDLTLWDIPVMKAGGLMSTNTVYHLNPTTTSLWVEFTPWVRLFFTFIIVTFSIWFITHQVGEALKMVELTPPGGYLKAGFAGAFGFVVSIGALVVAMAALPVLLAAGISIIYNFSGGTPYSPFGDSGVASAGSYASSVRLGLNVLAQLFPWGLATSLVLYLTVFNFTKDATVLFAMRFVKRMT